MKCKEGIFIYVNVALTLGDNVVRYTGSSARLNLFIDTMCGNLITRLRIPYHAATRFVLEYSCP